MTIIVDHQNKKVFDLVDGRDSVGLHNYFFNLENKDNVESISIDLSSTYRSVIKKHFKNATIVADRFHVHRLMTRLVNKFRKKVTGDDRKNPIRKLVLRNENRLEKYEQNALRFFLNHNPDLKEVHGYKEAINRFYRIKGAKRAKKAFSNLLDRMANSKLEKVKSLRATLVDWRSEILAYFKYKITNGRVEGFNRKAKLLQRKAFGYSSFENYRLRLLNESSRKATRR